MIYLNVGPSLTSPRPLPPPPASPTCLLLMFQREARRRPLDELGILISKCSREEIVLILKENTHFP